MSIRTIRKFFIATTFIFSFSFSALSFAQLPDFTRLVALEGRAVVNINTTQTVKSTVSASPRGLENDPFFEFFRQFSPPQTREYQSNSLGSGFIVTADGYVLTNAHVVAQADQITVTLTDKQAYKAKLIGVDARTDVALLKIDANNLPTVTLGKPETLKAGEWVVAIGSPFGFENSVSAGIVSAVNRRLPSETFVPFIQTDVAVNPGNSGGPLFNLKGEVVGINSQIYSRSGGFMGISFAIPIDEAMKVAEQLKTTGRVARGRLGVSIQEVTKDLAASFGLEKAQGALITSLEKGASADRAGVKAGDIILKIVSEAVGSAADLPRLVGNSTPGSKINLEVWRQGKAQIITATVDENKDDVAGFSNRAVPQKEQITKPDATLEKSGLMLQDLNPQQLLQLKKIGFDFGVLVIDANAVARKSGVARGDVIVGVAGNPLSNSKQLLDELHRTPKGKSIPLQILRQGQVSFIALPAAS